MTENNTNIPTNAIPMDNLIAMYAESKNGHGKSLAIARGSSGIVTIASSLLIFMILKSKSRLSTTYHRLLVGMSVGDIMLSLSLGTFNAMAPSDVSYMVWNARGNQATCSTQGFFIFAGMTCGLLYICSLNLYYLAMVKYNKTDSYIRTKIEPFLHGVPILTALILSITWLVKNYYNDSGTGQCGTAPVYTPPHCVGYEEGEVREGFKIPCGRGRDGTPYFMSSIVLWLGCPIIVGVSLGMIYRGVLKQEKRAARYGVGSLNPRAQQTRTADGSGVDERVGRSDPISRSITSVSSVLRRLSSNLTENSNSRAVLNRALAYSAAYLLAWLWPIVGFIMKLFGVKLPLWIVYLWMIVNPLQGLFNFAIFVHPKVVSAKKSGNRSWCQAFAKVFWSGGSGGNKRKAPSAPGDEKNTPVASVGKKNTSASSCGANKSGGHRNSFDNKEEKVDIEAPLGSDDFQQSCPAEEYDHEVHEALNEKA